MFAFKSLLLLSAAAFVSAAIAPRQSAGPCVYSCPAQDNNGDALTTETNPGSLTCQYDGANNCIYDNTSGALVTDNDNNECPATAVGSAGCARSKRAIDSKKLFEARARKPQEKLPKEVQNAINQRRGLRAAKGVASNNPAVELKNSIIGNGLP